MSDKLDEVIHAIAVRHGIVLGKDDPILVLQTMNERFFDEGRKAQQEILIQFTQEIEKISSRWKDDAQEKAENILNTALSKSKEVSARLLCETSNELIQTIKKIMSNSLTEVNQITKEAQRLNWLALVGSAIIFIGLFFVHITLTYI